MVPIKKRNQITSSYMIVDVDEETNDQETYEATIGEHRQLVTGEQVEFEK